MKNKRLIALLMCLVMVMSMFITSCGKNTDNDDDDDETEQVSPAPADAEKPDDGNDKLDDKDNPDDGKDKPTSTGNIFDYEKDISVLSLVQEDEFDQYLNELYLLLITTDSFTLHFKMENPGEYGINLAYTYGDDATDEFSQAFIEKIEEGLNNFDYYSLTESQQIVYDLLAYELDMYNQGEEFENFYIWSLAQNGNFLSNMQSLFTEYSIQTEQDAEDFTVLLGMLPDYLETAKEEIQEDNDNGARLTSAMLDMSIDMAEDWLSDEPEENIIYVAFEVNLQEAELDDTLEEEYLSKLADVIENEMIPAIEAYIDFLEGLEDDVDESLGLCNFDGGKEYYAWLLESYIGAGMTPDELYNYVIGKYDAAWDRIMEIAEEHPLAVSTFMMAKSKYSDDPEEIMEALAECAKEELPNLGDLNWIISYLDERQEVESIAAYYLSPQLDNIGRRVIRVNGSNVSDEVALFTTLAHEGIPGHLYQDEYTLRSDGYQELNSVLTYLGYQEGWAMYVEKLAYGWCLESEVNAELNNLNSMLSFMMISIADIGINYQGWTYDDFCDFMASMEITDDETLEYVYEMSISDPGLYPAYCFGYLLMEDTVNALIDEGNTAKEAYAKILDVGCSPYTILWERLGVNPVG